MLPSPDGSFSARPPTSAVLWDLDNKPPRGPPFPAALSLRRLASLSGRLLLRISAYANRHAFLHLPQWVLHSRRSRRHLDSLERKGLALPEHPYICRVCGRNCRTRPELIRHFRQLHERERGKKLARMRELKGKRREAYRRRFVAGDEKYEEAARELLVPREGYGLEGELRRAGVAVRRVEDRAQAADAAVKREMRGLVERGVDWVFLVSDDAGFGEVVGRAREAGVRTVVVGDGRRALGRAAEFWVPWAGVERGEVGEEALMAGRNGLVCAAEDFEEEEEEEDDEVCLSWTDEDEDEDEEEDYYV